MFSWTSVPASHVVYRFFKCFLSTIVFFKSVYFAIVFYVFTFVLYAIKIYLLT